MFGLAPPEITYLGRGSGPFDIGPARPDRMIVTFYVSESDAGNQLSSATIAGITANIVSPLFSSDPAGLAWAVVPTGTTASMSGNLAVMCSFMITGQVNNLIPYDSALFSQSQTVSTPEGFSAIITAGRSRNGYAPYTCSGTGAASAMAANDTMNNGGGGGADNPAWVVGSCVVTDGGGSVTITQNGIFVSPACYTLVIH